MITERAQKIALAIQQQCGGEVTLDQLFADTISGSETFLTAISMYFNKQLNLGGNVTHEATKWRMADILMANLDPREEMPTMLKWYIMHYEQYCRTNWDLTKILLDILHSHGLLNEAADNEQFNALYAELKENEKRINARLVSDGLGSLEAEIWDDPFADNDDKTNQV